MHAKTFLMRSVRRLGDSSLIVLLVFKLELSSAQPTIAAAFTALSSNPPLTNSLLVNQNTPANSAAIATAFTPLLRGNLFLSNCGLYNNLGVLGKSVLSILKKTSKTFENMSLGAKLYFFEGES